MPLLNRLIRQFDLKNLAERMKAFELFSGEKADADRMLAHFKSMTTSL